MVCSEENELLLYERRPLPGLLHDVFGDLFLLSGLYALSIVIDLSGRVCTVQGDLLAFLWATLSALGVIIVCNLCRTQP